MLKGNVKKLIKSKRTLMSTNFGCILYNSFSLDSCLHGSFQQKYVQVWWFENWNRQVARLQTCLRWLKVPFFLLTHVGFNAYLYTLVQHSRGVTFCLVSVDLYILPPLFFAIFSLTSFSFISLYLAGWCGNLIRRTSVNEEMKPINEAVGRPAWNPIYVRNCLSSIQWNKVNIWILEFWSHFLAHWNFVIDNFK